MTRISSALAHKGLTAQSRRRLRLPLLLLGALLLNVLAITGLTLHALRGGRAQLEASLESAREGALTLTGNEVEQALQDAVNTPFLLLKNLRPEDITAERVDNLRARFPGVEDVLILDRKLHLRQAFPATRSHHKRLAHDWIVQRTAQERQKVEHAPFAVHTFVETVDGHAALFAFQALSEPASTEPESWVLLRFRLEKLIEDEVAPLLGDFREAQNGSEALLLAPDDTAPREDVLVDINSVLPGWQLATTRARREGHPGAARLHEVAVISLAVGALVAIVLIAIAGWAEIRREHALIDLRNRFVANVSHELKTPLALIRMYAETLCLQRLPDPEKQRSYLQIMLRESERLSLMINDVLTFTRLRDGGHVFQLSATDLAHTVNEVIVQYQQHFAARGLEVEATVEDDLPPIAHDPNGVTQILLNLLDNAAKYAASGGRADVTLARRGKQLELAVTDYGVGIGPVVKERLARAFRAGDMVEEAEGSGLGLALVTHIAAAHGATFTLNDPLDHAGVRALLAFPIQAKPR